MKAMITTDDLPHPRRVPDLNDSRLNIEWGALHLQLTPDDLDRTIEALIAIAATVPDLTAEQEARDNGQDQLPDGPF